MQDEPRPECIWKPASQPRWRGRPEIMIGALIGLSVSCLTAGFVAGRLSGSPSAINVAHKSELPSPTPAVSDQPFKKQSERDTALVSDKAAPTVTILNPGTADAGTQRSENPTDARVN